MDIKIPPEGFDPYADRSARDIRNSLSRAFVRALAAGTPDPFLDEGNKWLETAPQPACRVYIQDRLPRFVAVLAEIKRERISDPLHKAVVIWNHGLFFEVHEQIEDFWHESTGGLHRALQGLILSAGVYVHLEAGNKSAARGLAEKAGKWLGAHGSELPRIANLRALIDALETPCENPPALQWQG
ncbi:MAG: DUF309 domain-containing protein [Desulfobacterales bacterium]|nr:DUF309 domain-containing protein [Desulfobacterales bacterium]